ncbi:hypothetical protein F5051DRAFT_205834 [Lentinula edodes]|nr:hypothetical protein F5051DRAFT_205834 [Lentinula edodes]
MSSRYFSALSSFICCIHTRCAVVVHFPLGLLLHVLIGVPSHTRMLALFSFLQNTRYIVLEPPLVVHQAIQSIGLLEEDT